ncbi:MAG: hypothetical protein KC983_09945, partial [Phycisphaerales bacterium]|nr:hypothetical protein [Phycisphaerales bacterium]
LIGLLIGVGPVGCSADLALECVSIRPADVEIPARDIHVGDRILRCDVVNHRGTATPATLTTTERSLNGESTHIWTRTTAAIPAGGRISLVEVLGRTEPSDPVQEPPTLLDVELAVAPTGPAKDTDRSNNRRVVDPGGRTLEGPPDIVFDEFVPSRLRGIEISTRASTQLGVPAGYYRLFEARNTARPEARCIAFVPTTGFPVIAVQRLDPWVFSEFVIDDRSPEAISIAACDLQGHRLTMRIACRPECDSVLEAHIDDERIGITTQDSANRLNTCDVAEEPIWGPVHRDPDALP